MGGAMTDVIGFLESLGARPAITAGDYAAAVAGLGLAPGARDALLARDVPALSAALGGRGMMWCSIRSPDESPEEETPRREDPARDDPQPQPEPDED